MVETNLQQELSHRAVDIVCSKHILRVCRRTTARHAYSGGLVITCWRNLRHSASSSLR